MRKEIKKIISEHIFLEEEQSKNDSGKRIIKQEIDLPVDLQRIAKIFDKNGYDIYLVGGAVRDALSGKTPKDHDLATNALPDDVINILGEEYKIIETGRQFNIINVITPQDNEYEIASFRSDESKGRRPSVKSASIESDILRRDLTINALFYDINKEHIVDMVGGYEDLKNGIIRTVGSAEKRFEEDPLRKLRTIRFAAISGGRVDKDISDIIKKDNDLKDVSKERIREEFIKGIEKSKSTKYFLDLLKDHKMITHIFDDLNVPSSFNNINSDDHIVVIASILKNNDKEKVERYLTNKGKYSREEARDIKFLIWLYKDNIVDNIYNIKKFQKKTGLSDEQVLDFGTINDMNIQLLKDLLSFELSVSGEDMIEQGFKGEKIGDEIKKREIENFKKFTQT